MYKVLITHCELPYFKSLSTTFKLKDNAIEMAREYVGKFQLPKDWNGKAFDYTGYGDKVCVARVFYNNHIIMFNWE